MKIHTHTHTHTHAHTHTHTHAHTHTYTTQLALLAAKSDPNLVDSRGHTPLHYAAHGGFVDIIRTLREAGAIETAAVMLL